MKVFDNGGATFDRYTVILDTSVFTMSYNATSPDGVNLYWGELQDCRPDLETVVGEEIGFKSLPGAVQTAIVQRQAFLTLDKEQDNERDIDS